MLLPVLSLLIPSGNINISMPFISSDANFGILGIVNIVTGGSLSYIFEMCSSAIAGEAFCALRNALLGYVFVVLCALFCFVFSIAGFISIRNMQNLLHSMQIHCIISLQKIWQETAVFRKKQRWKRLRPWS